MLVSVLGTRYSTGSKKEEVSAFRKLVVQQGWHNQLADKHTSQVIAENVNCEGNEKGARIDVRAQDTSPRNSCQKKPFCVERQDRWSRQRE